MNYSVQEPGGFIPPPEEGNDIVFFRKFIGSPDHSRMPSFISGELFGLRVERKNEYISKLPKSEKYQNDKLYNFYMFLSSRNPMS